MINTRTAALSLAALALTACEAPAPTAATTQDATAAAAAPAAATAGTPMPAGLNGEERVIWNSLTPQAKAQAAAYIANGGTLTQFASL